jgi:hypothetical protein
LKLPADARLLTPAQTAACKLQWKNDRHQPTLHTIGYRDSSQPVKQCGRRLWCWLSSSCQGFHSLLSSIVGHLMQILRQQGYRGTVDASQASRQTCRSAQRVQALAGHITASAGAMHSCTVSSVANLVGST